MAGSAPRRERIVQGCVSLSHTLQLFDSRDSLAETIGHFLWEGASRGERLISVVRPINWAAIVKRLTFLGLDVEQAIASGRLVVLDAVAALRAISHSGAPDAALFERTIGSVMRRLVAADDGVRAYGEMVDVVAGEGNFRAAEQIEAFWNALSTEISFQLFCGYSAVHFGDTRSSDALKAICAAHSRIHTGAADPLGSWLVTAIR